MKREKMYLFSLIIISFFFNIVKVNAELKLNKLEMIIGIDNPVVLKLTDSEGNIINDATWKSSDESIATVSNGIVTGKKASNRTIIISAISGNEVINCIVKVIDNYISVTSIKLDTETLSLLVKQSKKIVYSLLPEDATNKDVIFKSEDPKIATVDSEGNVTGVGDGTTNIILESESFQKKITVNVTSFINLKSIIIDKEVEINEMDEKVLNVTYNPGDATDKRVTWKSNNEEIVTVDTNGKITAKAPGEATITVTSNDGGYTASSKIIVKEIPKNVTGINLDKGELKLEKGEESTLEVIFTPTYAKDKEVTWKSSNTKIVKVDKTGKLTAIKAGNAIITATSHDGGYTATCKITVSSLPIEKIAFKKKSLNVYIGSNTLLETIATPEDSAIENAIWHSTDEEIATVDEDGTVHALKEGTTVISVSNQDGSIGASIELTVLEKPPEPFNVTIDGYKLNFNPDVMQYNLKINGEKSLKITTNYEDNVVINGNENLQDGSLITITLKQKNKTKKEYVIVVSKNKSYTIYFIGIISVFLLINIIRILVKNKKKKKR